MLASRYWRGAVVGNSLLVLSRRARGEVHSFEGVVGIAGLDIGFEVGIAVGFVAGIDCRR